jgi:hypothetical protein
MQDILTAPVWPQMPTGLANRVCGQDELYLLVETGQHLGRNGMQGMAVGVWLEFQGVPRFGDDVNQVMGA